MKVNIGGVGKQLIVDLDEEDIVRVKYWSWCWTKSKTSIQATVNNKTTSLPSFILNHDGNSIIDHKDRDKTNNQKLNFRFATHQQNCINRKDNKNRTHKYKGVYLKKTGKPWHAQIGYKMRIIHLGAFYTEVEAALAYNKKAIELFGEFAVLNEVSK